MNKIALTILLFLLPLLSKALEVEIDGIKYNLTIDEDNKPVAEVAWKWMRVPPEGYLQGDYRGAIIIPEKVTYEGIDFSVTKIGEESFMGSQYLTSVTIPNSVTSIGYHAFGGCTSLTSVTIPNSVTHLGGDAFSYCTSLTSVILPNSLEILDDFFVGCSSLKSITIPNSVKKIESYAFQGCTSLTSITIPNSVTSIGSSAFRDCRSLTSITIPNSVTKIEWGVFINCSNLKSVNLPNRIEEISASLFQNCESLTSIIIPNSVTKINLAAFEGCRSLTTVVVGTGMKEIENDAFTSCTHLKDFYCYAAQASSDSPSWKVFNGGASVSTATLHVPTESLLFYKLNNPWTDFGNVVALTENDPTPTDVKAIRKIDNNSEKTFDLYGRRIDQPKRGIYIKDGKKVIIRDFKR